MIRVVLADDHPVVLSGLERAIEEEAGLEVVARLENANGIEERLRALRADVLVIDLHMPGVGNLDRLTEIGAAGVPIVLFSLYAEGSSADAALSAGASFCVSKARPMRDVVRAVRHAHAGRRERPRRQAPHLSLSPREKLIFERILQGEPLKVIAIELELSTSTVHTYAGASVRSWAWRRSLTSSATPRGSGILEPGEGR